MPRAIFNPPVGLRPRTLAAGSAPLQWRSAVMLSVAKHLMEEHASLAASRAMRSFASLRMTRSARGHASAAKAGGDDIHFRRVGATRLRLDVADFYEVALQP